MLFASCMKEAAAPLATEISVDKQEVTFTGYAGSSAQIQKVQVTSNGDWFVTSSADWVTIKPTFGTAGVTNVEITVADNVDSYNELYGPRSTVVNFCYGTTGVAPLTVKQTGETGLDASRTYSLVKNQEDIVAGSYLIVFKNGDKHLAMEPLTASKTYGYLNAVEVTPEEEIITMPNASYAFTLEAVETGYNMIMADNRYIFMTGGYNSFNVSAAVADANPWTFTLNEDGTVQIAAVTHNNYIQYSTGYSSAGAYTSPQDGGLLPYLYKDAKAKSEEVLMVKDVTVPAFATSAKIKVQSNRTWSVRNHDEWIKTFTKKGKGEGVIEVTFDEYTSTTEARTATFQIIGEETNTFITFTQAKVAPAMTVEQFLAAEKGEFAILTGTIENIAKADYGNFDLQDETGTIYVYGLYDVNGGKVFTPLGLKEGDKVTLYGKKDVYKDTPQVASGVYMSHVSSKIRRKLAFDAETAEAKIGNPFTAPTLNGDATDVVYSSSDAAVATVDPATGEVTPLTEGTTTITANGPETETHLAGTASYTLTVTAKTPRALAFSAETAEATLGEEFTAPTLSGEAAGVVYSSSDTEVATVDPATGAVTLVAAGETTITATAAEDETFLAGTASYTLTVAEPYIPVIEDGKYWIVESGFVGTPELKYGSYGYMIAEEAWTSSTGISSTAANAFTFEVAEGGYTIKDSKGRYLYSGKKNDGTYYNTFNASATATENHIWTVAKNADGTYKITNKASTFDVHFGASYKTFECVANVTDFPELVKAENAVPAVEIPKSLEIAGAGETKTITLPEGVTVTPTCDNEAFSVSAAANVVTISAESAAEAKSGTLTLALAYNGFSITKTIAISQKAATDTSVTEVISGTFTYDESAKALKLTTTSGITITQAIASGSTAVNKSYNTAGTLRVYKGHKLTFSGKTFKKIIFEHSSSYAGNSVTASGGTYTPGSTSSEWSGSEDNVVITNTGTASNVQLRPTKITVIY